MTSSPERPTSTLRGRPGDSPIGSLYVVATPIGNLSDLSQRAVDTLRQVRWIAAEDTRVSRVLLQKIGASAQVLPLHAHNESQATPRLLERLRNGESGALISDAGTPAISDPGATLIAAAHADNLRVIPIPGASAALALLSCAGLPPGPFLFEGFLPERAKQREQRLTQLLSQLDQLGAHLLLFEAPHRIAACLASVRAVFPAERIVVIGRELTKMHEEIYRCAVAQTAAWLAADANRLRGEFVIGIAAGAPAQATFARDELTIQADVLLRRLLQDVPLSQAVRIAQDLTGIAHRELYQRALTLRSDASS
jgi:16S rRNA (cytidine1402-2'-O)-methyltransferase